MLQRKSRKARTNLLGDFDEICPAMEGSGDVIVKGGGRKKHDEN
jgi:hypothetical protein